MKHRIGILLFFITCNSFCQTKSGFNSFSFDKNIPKIITKEKSEEVNTSEKNNLQKSLNKVVIHKKKPAIKKSLPTLKLLITSKYGYRNHPILKKRKFHYGIDINTNKSKIFSVLNGLVIKSEYDKKLGYYIKIKHNNICTIYGHLSSRLVKKGDRVAAGDIIGISGSTGNSTGDHLHFAVRYNNKFINPELLINRLID